jgi:hypothetical protein
MAIIMSFSVDCMVYIRVESDDFLAAEMNSFWTGVLNRKQAAKALNQGVLGC